MPLLRPRLLPFILVLAAATRAAPPAAPADIPVMPSIQVGTTVSDLAKGYAEATRQLSESRIVIHYKVEGKMTALRGVRSVRAFHGVLLITLSGGESLILSAESIVMITDGGRTP